MMIRTLRLALLLAFCSAALAQPLYKWTESDGSITFSPDKPEKGVEFQTITAAEGVTASRIAVRAAKNDAQNETGSLQTSNSQQINFSSEASLQPIASSPSPTDGSSINSESGGSNAVLQASMSTMVQQGSGHTNLASTTASLAIQTQNRCEDLRKRVVSLERRLKSILTPQDMDNTIVHMSRHQKTYDRFCVQ